MFKKIATGFVSGALLLSTAAASFASTSVDVSGNGAKSHNTVKVKQSCDQSLVQSSTTNVGISLKLKGNSGDNSASGNTGGDVSIHTGDVSNSAAVTVIGGSNESDGPLCCCADGHDSEITVEGNGYKSHTTVKSKKSNTSSVVQESETNVWVDASLRGNSGKNKAKWNTGSGDKIETGDVENSAEVVVEGGSNAF